MNATIRLANSADAGQIQAIYAPYVSQTAISFELEPPSVAEMRQRILDTLLRFPWLVCEKGETILGYAYASPYRVRAAYQWSVDTSVYIQTQARRMGIGRALYASLFKILCLQGYYNAYAGITLPNPGSVGLHEALGFERVGVYREVGYKMGAWHDVGWWQLALQPRIIQPEAPKDLGAAQQLPGWQASLAVGEALLKG